MLRFRSFVSPKVVLLVLFLLLISGSINHSRNPHSSLPAPLDEPFGNGCQDLNDGLPTSRANGTLLMLARKTDLAEAAITSIEKRFNLRAGYPLALPNDEEFQPEFDSAVRSLASGSAAFATMPKHMCRYSPNLDLSSR